MRLSQNLENLVSRRARQLCSGAKTVRGQLRAIKIARLDGTLGRVIRCELRPPRMSFLDVRPKRNMWQRAARRAIADPVYREATLNSPPADLDALAPYMLFRKKVIDEILVLNPGKLIPAIATNEQLRCALLPVGWESTRAHGLTESNRGENHVAAACWSESHYVHTPGETEWSNGRPVKYTRARHCTYIRAYYVINRGIVYARVHNHDMVIPAPKGYRWDRDANGLKLVARDCADADFHPTARQLELRGENCAALITLLEENRATRRALAAERAEAEKAMVAALRTGYISLADSKAAGNCLGGSASWAGQRGLDHRTHIPLRVVARLAQATDVRAQNAIRAAATRHAREMQQGVCMLSDHHVGA